MYSMKTWVKKYCEEYDLERQILIYIICKDKRK